MKVLSISFLLITLSLSVFADRGQEHFAKMCENEIVKEEIGAKGLCNIVVSPSVNYLKGICSGLLLGKIPCTVIYNTAPDAVYGMRVVCGDLDKPILDQVLETEATVYNVSALIRRNDGKPLINKDPSTHANIQTALVLMEISESSSVTPVKSASIQFVLNDIAHSLIGVSCQ